jgi:hypothetical protein
MTGPSFFRRFAIFAIDVVLPVPLTPATSTTVGPEAARRRAVLSPERMPFTWAFQEGDTLVRRLDRPILPCGSDGLHDLADGPRPDVGRIEVLFELIDEFRVEVATEGQDGADAAEDLLLRLAEALLEGRGEFAEHAVSLLPSRASNARFHPSRGRECR